MATKKKAKTETKKNTVKKVATKVKAKTKTKVTANAKTKLTPKKATNKKPSLKSVPTFSLPDESGKLISLSQFKGKKVILYFYPKDDTPGCTQESCDFRDSFSRLQSRGVIVLGVSKDSVKSHVKFKQKYSLPFSLLSDEGKTTCEDFGVWKEKSMYGKTYMGIERTTFLIQVNSSGKSTFLKVYTKVSVQGHVDEILKDLV
jgi:thioredoxin-dependent peroxiredoxin